MCVLQATYAYAADVTRDTKTARGKNFTLITGMLVPSYHRF
jgi:hypothetical protein